MWKRKNEKTRRETIQRSISKVTDATHVIFVTYCAFSYKPWNSFQWSKATMVCKGERVRCEKCLRKKKLFILMVAFTYHIARKDKIKVPISIIDTFFKRVYWLQKLRKPINNLCARAKNYYFFQPIFLLLLG